MASTSGPRGFPFFKHVKFASGDEFIIFSDGVDVSAQTFAAFDAERVTAVLPAYPVLQPDSNGREYYPNHKHVETFQGSNRNEPDIPSEHAAGNLNDDALDAYILNIASFTTL